MAGDKDMAVGTLSYNGFVFPPALKMKARAEFVPTSNGRATKYTKYTLEVETVLHPGADEGEATSLFPDGTTNTDGLLATGTGVTGLRKLLGVQGARLVVTGKGLGNDLDIDTIRQPVMYGPHPRVLVFRELISNKAVYIVWIVEVHLADCIPNVVPQGKIADYSYEEEFELDNQGLTSRAINGQIEVVPIALSRAVRLTGDWWRRRLAFEVPIGFERSRQRYQLSADRRFLRFSIVDTEIPSPHPFPRGVIRPDIRQRVKSSTTLIGKNWNVSISGSISVAMGVPKYFAWLAFLSVVRSRLNASSKATRNTFRSSRTDPLNESSEVTDKISPGYTMMGPLEIEDDVYGLGMRFSLSWSILTDVGSLFEATGLWEQVDSRDTWATYRASMTQATNTWTPHGHARLSHDDNSDATITICTQGNARSFGNRAQLVSPYNERDVFQTRCPSPEQSWVCFDSETRLLCDQRQVVVRGIGGTVTDNRKEKYDFSKSSAKLEESIGYSASSGGAEKHVIHRQGEPRLRVRFKGFAVRIGYEIQNPILLKFGGVKVIPISEAEYIHREIMKLDDCPVYFAAWDQIYELPSVPSGTVSKIDPDVKGMPKCK